MPKQILSPEVLQSALDLIEKGVTRPTKIATAIGVAYRTYCNWMVRSNGGDPEFMVTYNDTPMQFAQAIKLATRLAALELRGMVLQEAVFGYDEVQTSDGNVVWAFDPEACAIEDVELREMVGYRKDGLLVRDGKLVPVTIRRKAPFAQQIRMLEAFFPDMRPTSTVNQNLNVRGGIGVAVAKPVDYSATRAIPAAPPIPLAPPLPDVTDAEFVDVSDDPELADMIDGPPGENLIERAVPTDQPYGPVPPSPPVAVAVNITLPEASATSAEPVPDVPVPPTAVPMGVADAPRRTPRSQLEADLMAKLDAARNKPKPGSAPNV
jgi:hypothetical protein